VSRSPRPGSTQRTAFTPASPVMALLAHGVPISLLCDLVSTVGPDSQAINSTERPATDTIWLEAAETLQVRFRAVWR
jgi:hypothetical protein